MKQILQILTLLILTSCGQEKIPSNFYELCDETGLNLDNGIEVSDSLGYFSYRIPDSTWKPQRILNDKENGLTVGDTALGYIRLFNVNQSDYTHEWNWEEEQKNVEKDFNVIETGEILLNGSESRYNIVFFESDTPQMISFYITVLDTIRKRQYTLNITTEFVEDFKSRICKMKPLMESFKIKN
jgi:hypothetical protein